MGILKLEPEDLSFIPREILHEFTLERSEGFRMTGGEFRVEMIQRLNVGQPNIRIAVRRVLGSSDNDRRAAMMRLGAAA